MAARKRRTVSKAAASCPCRTRRQIWLCACHSQNFKAVEGPLHSLFRQEKAAIRIKELETWYHSRVSEALNSDASSTQSRLGVQKNPEFFSTESSSQLCIFCPYQDSVQQILLPGSLPVFRWLQVPWNAMTPLKLA